MADADKSKPGTGRSAESRRKRPPVTIDLEAEAVSEIAADAPSADSRAADPQDAAPEVADPEIAAAQGMDPEVDEAPAHAAGPAEPALEPGETAETLQDEPSQAELPGSDPETAMPTEAIERRRAGAARYVPVIAAALLGGIVGALVVAFLFAPQTDTVTQASIDSRFQALDGRLGRLETSVKDLPSTSAPQDDGRLSALEAEVASLKSAVAKIESSASASGSTAEVPSVDLSPLEARIAALENRPVPAETPPVDLSPLQTRLGELKDRLDQIEAHPPSDPKTEAAAKTIALTSLRQAASAGGSFADELSAYAALGGEASALQPLAAAGAPSVATLQAEFPAIAERIRAASAKVDPNASMWERLAASAGSLIEVKPAGPIQGTSPTAVLSRMEAAVADGDLQTALREADGLDAAARVPLADWAEGAKRRIAIDAALAALPPATGSNG